MFLQSELTIIGNIAVLSGSHAASSVGLDELVDDLRRARSSTSYTYLYQHRLVFRQKGLKTDVGKASFWGARILFLAARTMVARQSCMLGSSITKVRSIRSVEVLEPRLVTCEL